MKPSNSSDNREVLRQILTLVAILAAFGVNVLANVAPFNGNTIGEIANTTFKDVLIIPANYAFAIWGLIYLGLISFGIYQVLPSQRQNPRLREIGYLVVVASLAQIVWVPLFQYRLFALSLAAMLLILLPLCGAYQHLGIGAMRVSRQETWLVRIPISIYLGWISVATIVNVAIVLYDSNWSGWGLTPGGWTVIMLAIAAAIAAVINNERGDLAFPLVIVWALVAIAVRHLDTLLISGVAGGLAILLIVVVLVQRVRRWTNRT